MSIIAQGASLSQAVGETAGAISLCWEHPENAGVFKSQEAAQLVSDLVSYIQSTFIDTAVVEQSADYVDVYRDEGGLYRWRRKDAGNHETLSTSGEGFNTLAWAIISAGKQNSDVSPENIHEVGQ